MAQGNISLKVLGNSFDKESFLKSAKVSKKAKARFEKLLSEL